jgi:DNA-binding transcriptional LysR family regulator
MDYNRVALFVRVVRAGTLTAAAAEVGLPKSSVSRSLTTLESDLGVRLLHRTSRKLALTDAGHAFYDSVRGSISAIDEADELVRERTSEPRGLVRIAAGPPISGDAPAFVELRKRYPGIRIEIGLSTRHVDLVAEGFDLAVRAGRLEDSSLISRRIGSTAAGLVASPAYLRVHGRPKTIADLAAHDWVLMRAPGGRASLKLQGPDGPQMVEVAPQLVVDDLEFCRRAAEAGAGITLLPKMAFVRSIEARALEQVLPGWSDEGPALHVVMPSARHVPARVRLVADYLVEYFTAQLASFEARCDAVKKRRSA